MFRPRASQPSLRRGGHLLPIASLAAAVAAISAASGGHLLLLLPPPQPLAWGATERLLRRPGSRALRPVLAAAAAEAEVPSEADIELESGEDFYLKVLKDLARRGLSAKAEDALYDMIDEGSEPGTPHYNAVMESCAAGADTERAERWLFRMRALDIAPDLGTFNALIRVAAEAKDTQGANRWLEEAWNEGYEPDLQSYQGMLHALRRSGETAAVEAWLENMMEAGVEPDVVCANTILATFAEQQNVRKVDEWLAIAEQNLGVDLNVESFNIAMGSYAVSNDMESLDRLMQAMIDRGLEPDSRSYALLIGDGKQFRDPHAVEKWSEKLMEARVDINADAYRDVIRAWASLGNAPRAEEWFVRMFEEGKPTAEALAILAESLVMSGREGAERASEWVDQVAGSGVALSPATYAALASRSIYEGDFEQVEAAMQKMEADGLEMDADGLTALLLAYANARPQQSQLAEQMFKQHMLRGKIEATREVLEALRAAVGGSRCLSLRRELQLSTPSAPTSKTGSIVGRGGSGARTAIMKPKGQGGLPAKEPALLSWE